MNPQIQTKNRTQLQYSSRPVQIFTLLLCKLVLSGHSFLWLVMSLSLYRWYFFLSGSSILSDLGTPCSSMIIVVYEGTPLLINANYHIRCLCWYAGGFQEKVRFKVFIILNPDWQINTGKNNKICDNLNPYDNPESPGLKEDR
jgi:hypothetical protein